jgi:dihydrofolate reductase
MTTTDKLDRTNKEHPMRKIVSYLFITLDGVVESPEKWVMYNDQMGTAINEMSHAADTLLLGRRTYDTFAASWPQRTNEDDPLADWMNNTAKVVVSSTLQDPTWNNTSAITSEVDKQVQLLKEQDGNDILISGSPTLVRSLLKDKLLDELRLFVHPIVAGTGLRLFGDDSASLKLADSKTLDNGVLYTTYKPAGD